MNFMHNILDSIHFAIFIFIFITFISTIGTIIFRKLAINIGILANPNFRSLHEIPKPKGGGIVFFFMLCFIHNSVLVNRYFTLQFVNGFRFRWRYRNNIWASR